MGGAGVGDLHNESEGCMLDITQRYMYFYLWHTGLETLGIVGGGGGGAAYIHKFYSRMDF